MTYPLRKLLYVTSERFVYAIRFAAAILVQPFLVETLQLGVIVGTLKAMMPKWVAAVTCN